MMRAWKKGLTVLTITCPLAVWGAGAGPFPPTGAVAAQGGVPATGPAGVLPPAQMGTPGSYYSQTAGMGASGLPSANPAAAGMVYQPAQNVPLAANGAPGVGVNVPNANPAQVTGNQAVYPGMAPQAPAQGLPPLTANGGSAIGRDAQREDLEAIMANYLSMTPDQIRALRRGVDVRAQAASELPGPPPQVGTSQVLVSLAPGSVPPVVRPFIGQGTSFVVVDSSGQPWPVENFHVSNHDVFDVERLDPAANGSSFTIESKKMYGHSNLILKLAGVVTPAVVDLVSGQKVVDERVEVRVMGRGPNSTTTSVGLTPGTDSRLLPVLDGVPPEGGKRLAVTGVAATSAWMMPSGRMVVRTPLKVVSPNSSSFVSSADGTNVYEFPPTPQLVGLQDGTFVNVMIGGW